jgi:hypothetical protein
MRVMDTAPDQKGSSESTLNSEPQAVVVRRESERDLFTWTAPARPFKRRDKQFYTTVFAIAGIVSLVLFLAEGIMPVILIVALVFLFYVLSTVPPENIEYKVTTKGVRVAGKLTEWQALIRFWFGKRAESEILIFETFLIPGRIEIVINPEIKDGLKKEISAYIPYEEIPATGLDRVTNWVAQKLPGNK